MRTKLAGVISLIILILISTQVFARDEQTNIDYIDVQTKMEIDTEGALQVTQTIQAQVESDLLLQQIDISTVSEVQELIVKIKDKNGEFIELDEAKQKEEVEPSFYYKNINYGERILMDLYMPTMAYKDKNGEITYQISYKAKDVVWAFTDACYFEWPIFKNTFQTLRNFELQITYPQAINENINELMMGAIFQSREIVDDWTVNITSTYVEIENEVIFSVIMPKSFCLDARKRIDAERSGELIKLQDENREEMITRENAIKQRMEWKQTLMTSSITIFVLGALAIYFVFGRKTSLGKKQWQDKSIPEFGSPAEMGYQVKRKIMETDIYATLIDLCYQGVLIFMNKGGEIVFELRNVSVAQTLKRHERYLVNWLFEAYDASQISTTKIFEVINRDDKKYKAARYKTWSETVKRQSGELVQGEPIVIARIIGLTVVLTTSVMAVMLIAQFQEYAIGGAIIFCAVLLAAYALSLRTYSDEEKERWQQCKGLNKSLKQMTLKENQTLDYNELEERVAYAVSFNKEKNILEVMSQQLKKEVQGKVFKDQRDIDALKKHLNQIRSK